MIQTTKSEKRYFSQQSRFSNLCGMHVINNFLGCEKYSEKKMNEICENLSPDCINPHKSIFGGDYDVNVLISVFQLEGYDLVYHDHRNPIELSFQQCGFILNYDLGRCPLFKLFGSGRHWELIKRQKNEFIEYDSLQETPIPLSNTQLLRRLRSLTSSDCTILKIVQSNLTEVLVHPKGNAS